jgi:hypothetical protein
MAKRMNARDQFEKIAAEAVSQAEAVKCPFDVFVEGLREIEVTVRERRYMAEDEQKQRGE